MITRNVHDGMHSSLRVSSVLSCVSIIERGKVMSFKKKYDLF